MALGVQLFNLMMELANPQLTHTSVRWILRLVRISNLFTFFVVVVGLFTVQYISTHPFKPFLCLHQGG